MVGCTVRSVETDAPFRQRMRPGRSCGRDSTVRIVPACILGFLLLSLSIVRAQDQAAPMAKGGIRGIISDADFNVPVPQAKVSVPEANRTTVTSEDGHYLIADLAPGVYTVVFAKEGFVRETRINVLVLAGAFADVDTRLFGEYTDMEELVVSDIDLGGGTEAGLLNIQQQSAGIMDSVGSDMIGRAQRNNAADAIKLVTGASVEGGKYAAIRGLGDRYTSTLINSVRLPSADPEKRAVQLDQFPSAAIESIQVSKTFMPDQQGDSGAGTINIVTRSVPAESILDFKIGTSYKPGITGNSDFRTNPRSTSYWGEDDRDLGTRDAFLGKDPDNYYHGLQINRRTGQYLYPDVAAELTRTMQSLDTRMGTTTEAPPPDTSWGFTVGDVYKLGDDWRIGGVGTFSYSCKYEGYNGGINSTKVERDWVVPGQFTAPEDAQQPFTTSLGVQKILWGGMATMGLRKGDEQDAGLTFVGNHAADSYAQENVVNNPGNSDAHRTGYQEILDYLERDFYSVQEHGRNTLPFFENWNAIPGILSLQAPVFEWTFAQSDSHFYEPDRSVTYAEYENQNDEWTTSSQGTLPPGSSRSWYTIDEQSRQMFFNLKQPFENWSGDKGYLKAGYFDDMVKREYTCDYTKYYYSGNLQSTDGSGLPTMYGPLSDPIWDYIYSHYLGTGQGGGTYLQPGMFDNQPPVDYTGNQEIQAWYLMGDLPVLSWLHAVGGVRAESTFMQTQLHVVTCSNISSNDPQHQISTFEETTFNGLPTFVFTSSGDPNHPSPFDYNSGTTVNQVNMLPAFGLVIKPWDDMVLRLNWSQTIARPTFKEITPILTPIQGTSDAFIGNSDLKISTMDNYDARLEVFPGAGNVVACSVFYKSIQNPIDRILLQTSSGLRAIMPLNFPSATLEGAEAEARQALGEWWRPLNGLSVGANGTLLKSKLQYDQAFQNEFADFSGDRSRPMIGQPDYLANLNATYDIDAWGLSLNTYYTFQGTTLVAGESTSEFFLLGEQSDSLFWTPNVYQKPIGTLNMSVSKTLDTNWKVTLGAKNLLRPDVTQYYDFRGSKFYRTKYSTPIEYTFGLEGKW